MVPPKSQKKHDKKAKRPQFHDQEDIERLKTELQELDTKDGVEKFSDLPLSRRTSAALQQSHFTTMTDIQRRSIPLALKGNDILGAAKTGSGKTLAFIVPVLELLFREQWSKQDGLGALIISPTRELAAQIFEVLRKVGRNHTPSAGLIEGGMNFKEEADRIPFMNVIVGTPGRLLQHLDRTPGFLVDNLQALVLDEADRILDMGFQNDVDALVEHLPKTRQTMLFSATQTKKVSDLARLSLNEPEYISVHEKATQATPVTLTQGYIVTELPSKLDTLWSFIKANLKSKMIVFLSSSKQVRFVFEAFRKLKPGVPLMSLYGRKGQEARLKITSAFASSQHACLIATDVVARGIDFPYVDWVVQVDCPEDADTYIHRVGRTARNENDGRAVLFLDPSEEEGMLKNLELKKISLSKMNVRQNKKKSIQHMIQELCFKDSDLKYIAQKAFTYYAQAVNQMKDKSVFQIEKLDLEGFAASLGLPGAPQLRFQKGLDVKKVKNAPREGLSDDSDFDDDNEDEDAANEKAQRRKEKLKEKNKPKTKYDRLFDRQNQDVLSGHYGDVLSRNADSDDEMEDFLKVKRVIAADSDDEEASDDNDDKEGGPRTITHLGPTPFIVDSSRRAKALTSKKALLKFRGAGTKMYFDEDTGEARPVYVLKDEAQFHEEGPVEERIKEFMEKEKEVVAGADREDKAASKEMRRQKMLKRKNREKEEREAERDAERDARREDKVDDERRVAVLAGGLEDGAEDGLALLRSLPMAGEGGGYDSDSDSGDGGEEEVHERPRKKMKRGRDEDDDGDERGAKKEKKSRKKKEVLELDHHPETLEDLEAVAEGLLG